MLLGFIWETTNITEKWNVDSRNFLPNLKSDSIIYEQWNHSSAHVYYSYNGTIALPS